MSTESALAPTQLSVDLVPLRWWHLPAVMRLEAELFGDEQWSESAFWSELAGCPPTLTEGSPCSYWAAVETSGADPADAAEGNLLGYAGVAVAADEGYVQTLGVARRAQRRGVGARLLRRLLDDARAEGATAVWLEVRDDNAGAQAMYAAFGFRVRGRRRGYYQPSNTDALVMSVELAARPRTARRATGGERP